MAQKFAGPTVTVVEETAWGPADASGTRTGRTSMTIPGQPVTMKGTVELAAGGPGTVAELTGELKVAIPLLGKKLEQSTAPAVVAGFRVQQKIGDNWLAKSEPSGSTTRERAVGDPSAGRRLGSAAVGRVRRRAAGIIPDAVRRSAARPTDNQRPWMETLTSHAR